MSSTDDYQHLVDGENLISVNSTDSQILDSVGEAIEQWLEEISFEEH